MIITFIGGYILRRHIKLELMFDVVYLKKMSQFAKEFSENEIRLQPVTQIPWGTLITVILPKSKFHEEMLWYIYQTYKNGWSIVYLQ